MYNTCGAGKKVDYSSFNYTESDRHQYIQHSIDTLTPQPVANAKRRAALPKPSLTNYRGNQYKQIVISHVQVNKTRGLSACIVYHVRYFFFLPSKPG